MLYWNYKIYKKLHEHSLNKSLSKNVVGENRELLYFMIADTVIPLVFFTVYHVAKVVYVYRENPSLKLFLPAFYSTAATVRCLAILALLRPYRKALKNMFCCRTEGTSVLRIGPSNGVGSGRSATGTNGSQVGSNRVNPSTNRGDEVIT